MLMFVIFFCIFAPDIMKNMKTVLDAMKIGIDLGGTNMRVGLIDGATLVNSVIEPCPSKGTEEEVLCQLKDCPTDESYGDQYRHRCTFCS